MPVSLARMYENALDWQHLPHLHSRSFSTIDCLDSGQWGWRAKTRLEAPDSRQMASSGEWLSAVQRAFRQQPIKMARYAITLVQQTIAMRRGINVELELLLHRDEKRWVTTTLSGPGAGSQVITDVVEHGERDIEVTVHFVLPGVPQALRAPIGHYYQALYSVLYDEDEQMMLGRQQQLDRLKQREPSAAATPASLAGTVSLGSLTELKTQLPKRLEHAGKQWRIVELDGELIVHSTVCPHQLGPLDSEVRDGQIECPWHGFRFDLRSGRQIDGRCKLAEAPPVRITADGEVLLG